MPKKRRPEKTETGGGDKADTQTIAVYRHIAKMATAVAQDEGLTVAALTGPLLEGPLRYKYAKLLERELRELSDRGE